MTGVVCARCGGRLERSGACARCDRSGPAAARSGALGGRLAAVGAVVVVLVVWVLLTPPGAWDVTKFLIFASVGAFMMVMAWVVSAGFVEA